MSFPSVGHTCLQGANTRPKNSSLLDGRMEEPHWKWGQSHPRVESRAIDKSQRKPEATVQPVSRHPSVGVGWGQEGEERKKPRDGAAEIEGKNIWM